MKYYKIVFMGTPDFAVPVLEKLINDGHEILAVVTQPDRKSGRGKVVSFSAVKQIALENNLKVLQPEKIRKKEVVKELSELNPELFITCAYGQILSQAILDIPKFGCINVHASLLPAYRGAAPIHRAVMNGDKITGITTMMTDRGMDTGDILLKAEVEIGSNTTSGELHDVLMKTGADIISETLLKLGDGNLLRIPQDDSQATHAPMLKKEESIVDWNNDSKSIHNKVRALNPWPGCFTKYLGKRMRIIKSEFSNADHQIPPGTITTISNEKMEIACGTGYLYINELQFANGKPMEISQCWHNMESGVVLGQEDS